MQSFPNPKDNNTPLNLQYSPSPVYSGIIVFLFSLFLFSSGIHLSSIYILDESKNAQCAWEMMTDNHLITPTFNGKLRTDKPPLHYYFMMIGYTLFGKSAYSARIFSAIIGSFFMLLFFQFICKYSSRKHAWWTMFILWSGIHFVLEFHLSVPDPYLITCIGLSLLYFYEANENQKLKYPILMYTFMGLGVLAKGPIAILLPGFIMLVYLIASKRLGWTIIKKLHPILGLFIVTAIAFPWYCLVYEKTDGLWVREFFFNHNINRFESPKEGHGGFFLQTILFYFIGFIPYIFFMVPFLKFIKSVIHNKLILLSTITSISFILFFTFSGTKLPNYAMPAYPFTALLFGAYFSESYLKDNTKNYTKHYIAPLIFSVLLIHGVIVGIQLDKNLNGLYYLAYILILLPIGSLMAIYFASKKQLIRSIFSLVLSYTITGVLLMTFFFPAIDKTNPVIQSQSIIQAAHRIAYYKNINPAFIFKYGLIKELTTKEEISTFFAEPDNVLLTTDKGLKEMDENSNIEIKYQCTDLFDSRKTRIVTKNQSLSNN